MLESGTSVRSEIELTFEQALPIRTHMIMTYRNAAGHHVLTALRVCAPRTLNSVCGREQRLISMEVAVSVSVLPEVTQSMWMRWYLVHETGLRAMEPLTEAIAILDFSQARASIVLRSTSTLFVPKVLPCAWRE